MTQDLSNLNKNKVILVIAVPILSFIFSLFINSVLADSVWISPMDNPPKGGPNAPLYNEETGNPKLYAIIDQMIVTLNGDVIAKKSLQVGGLLNCGKVYTDASGNFKCGTDEVGSGIVSANNVTPGTFNGDYAVSGKLTIGSGGIVGTGSKGNTGALTVTGMKGGYAGINFNDGTNNLGTFVMSAGTQGYYNDNFGDYYWRFVNGVLDRGYVPLSQTTGQLDISSHVTGAMDISSHTSGSLPFTRVSGTPSFTCITKNSTTSNTNTAGDGYHYSTVSCDTGWTMTGGGCNVDHWCWTQVLRNSHPTADNTGWYCEQSISQCDWSHGGTAYVRCCKDN